MQEFFVKLRDLRGKTLIAENVYCVELGEFFPRTI